MAKLEVKKLTHHFGFTKILSDISFSLEKGKVLSIVGPSGGGKSTLLQLCARLLDVVDGKIENTFDTSSFAFQEPRLLPWKNVVDNITLGLLAQKIDKKEAVLQAKQIALKFGLEETDFNKFPKDLSGGMRQRVSFARALAIEPSLLFLDEPFSALDIGLKKELQNHLIKGVQNKGLSILFITHDLMEAIRLSDEILVLKKDPGEIVKKITFTMPQNRRDNTFVYEQSAKLLTDDVIIKTFELGVIC
jgi:NitT/TauT family transport system ATP-binding protein